MENLPKSEKERQGNSNPDNSAHDEFENVANPMRPGSEDESGDPAQGGRNLRALGSTDQDSANGLLRMNDQDNSTMEVTPEAEKSVVGVNETTNTSTVSVTTAGPDDDASADETPVPAAQKEAKAAADGDTDANDSDTNSAKSQQQKEDDVAETGTDLNFQPAA